MLRIGDFSQLAQISVPTLRHYDDLGLLKPAHVDRFTDYRYYEIDQLPRLNRILALKDLGLSLDQIAKLLKEDMPPAQLRGMLAMKRAEIEQQLEREQARLMRVEARLQQIEGESSPSSYDVVLKRVEAQTIAGVHQVVPHVTQMGGFRRPVLDTLYDWLTENNVSTSDIDVEMMIYHSAEYTDENIEMEATVVLSRNAVKLVARGKSGGNRITIRDLPAIATMASTIHFGALYDIPQAIIAVFAWIGGNGYRSAGPIRELHLYGRECDVQTEEDARAPRVMEIQIPVEREQRFG
jgi:DNA-binding transcriptional MerR regulator